MLLNPVLIDGTYPYDGAIYAPICGPFTIVVFFGVLGYTVKRLTPYPKSIGIRIIYDFIVYDLFISLSLAFILPLFYNSVQFLLLVS